MEYLNYGNLPFKIKHVCEIGTYTPNELHCNNLIQDETIKFTLIDANPNCINLLKERFTNNENVIILNYAIANYTGKINLYNRWDHPDASAFIEGLPSCPAVINDAYSKNSKDIIECDCTTFDKIDTGDIDILFIDIEGAEWFVLKNMISKPKIISLETHGYKYTNPYMQNINDWVKENNYSIMYKGQTDTYYKLSKEFAS
jgi:FkbM family methyltransferase